MPTDLEILQTLADDHSAFKTKLEAGYDADAAAWLNAQPGTPTAKAHDLTYTDMARMMGAVRVSEVRAAAVASEVAGAAHLVTMIDSGAALPLLAPGNDTYITSLAAGGIITEGEAAAIAGLIVQAQSLAQEHFGANVSADRISNAMAPVRINNTVTLVENWIEWSPE